jgi:hypothetical protein
MLRRLLITCALSASALNAQETPERDSVLSRVGFYERAAGVRPSTGTARFIGPEEIRDRPLSRISQLLTGQLGISVAWQNDRAVHLGRAGSCPVTFLIDGYRVFDAIEERYSLQRLHFDSWNATTPYRAGGSTFYERPSIDHVLDVRNVVAVEIYSTAGAAPIELQRFTPNGTCALVAIWTGRLD